MPDRVLHVTVDGQRVRLEGYGGEDARWTVSVDGEALGEVLTFARHFNLRRPLTIRGWRAMPRDAAKRGLPCRLPEGTDVSCFSTRADAIGALLELPTGLGGLKMPPTTVHRLRRASDADRGA